LERKGGLCVWSSSRERVWYAAIVGLPNKVVIIDGVGFGKSRGNSGKLFNALIANPMITTVVSRVPTLPVSTSFKCEV
jgi:hypothetical protein